MIDLNKLIIVEVCDVFKVGEIMFVELIEVCLLVIDVVDVLNVYVYKMFEIVIEQVKVVDVCGYDGVVLNGILLGIKDLFCIKGIVS